MAVGATGVAVGGGRSGVTVAVGMLVGVAVDVPVMGTVGVVVSTDVAVAADGMGVAVAVSGTVAGGGAARALGDAGAVATTGGGVPLLPAGWARRLPAGGRVSKRASKHAHTTRSTARE